MTSVIVYLLVVGMLAALMARAGDEVSRLVGWPTRWAWAGSMLLLVAFAAWAPFRIEPPMAIPLPAVSADSAAPAVAMGEAGVMDVVSMLFARARTIAGDVPGRLIGAAGDAVPAAARGALGPAWAAMSVALLALLGLAYVGFTRRVGRLPVAEMHGATVHVSPTAGPAVVGLARPRIVVPAWLLDATPEEQQLAVVHEREHLDARDPLLLIGGCIVVALLPWHPASWWMLSRLRLAVEMDCDRRVLARGVGRRTYGAALIDIAARCARLPLGVPALADHTTQLERRLIAMTPAPVSFRRTRTLAVGAAAVLTLAAACETRLPSAPEIDRMDVAALEGNSMARVALASDSARVYLIDGREATAAEANALAADQIASVQITRMRAPGEVSTISILTRAAAEASDTAGTAAPAGAVRFKMESGQAVTLRPTEAGPLDERFTGLVIIDGVKSDPAALARLAPAQIEQIEVIKGASASRAYTEPEAANGVIRVTTKKRQ